MSSVSTKARFVRRCRQRPAHDLPAPIIPMRTIDLPGGFTDQYLINTRLQPSVIGGEGGKPFQRLLIMGPSHTALKRGVNGRSTAGLGVSRKRPRVWPMPESKPLVAIIM